MRGVERMDGADAGFLYMETPTQHMHTLKIAVLEPHDTLTFDTFRSGVLARLDKLPPLRRKAVSVPFHLNHPVWVTQGRIDEGHHFVRHQVGGTGSRRDLERLIGEIASTPLDRAHPLWELHFCEGMADGGTAIVGKMHHALADGMAANALLGNVTDVAGSADFLPREAREGSAPEETPPPAALVRSALWDAIVQIALIPMLVWRTVRGIRSVVRYRRAEEPDVPRPVLDAPRTSFNRALTPNRSFATCTLPLEDVKAVRRAHPGVTLNDVVLAVVGGALRSWLDDRGEHPSASLMAGVPTATDTPDPGGPPRLHGNRVSNLFTSLATDVDDPHERLRAINRVTTHSKQIQRELGPEMLTEWVQFTPPAPFSAVMRLYSRVRAASWHAPPFNVVVSNVPGPRETAHIGEAELSDLFSVGPILEGIGLNVTVWSYVDRMNFSLLSCPELIDDLGPLAARFGPALEELMT